MDAIDECKAAVAALLPKVEGVDMSFLPVFRVNTPTSSDFDSSNKNDSSGDDDTSDSDAVVSNSDSDDDDAEVEPIAKKSCRVYERKPMEKSAWWYLFLSPLAKE